MGRAKKVRHSIGLTPEASAKLRRDAAAHGVSMTEYVESLVSQRRPGSKPGSLVAIADKWWDTRIPKRRVSVYLNHNDRKHDTSDDQDPDQLTIFEEVTYP